MTVAVAILPGGAADAQERVGSITPPLTIGPATGERLAVKQVSRLTGHVTFAATDRAGLLLEVDPSASPETRARAFIDQHGRAFGLEGAHQLKVTRQQERDEVGIEHVRFQQVHKGIPVRAGEFVVHLKGARVTAANGHLTGDLPEDVTPAIPSEEALAQARHAIEKNYPLKAAKVLYSEPRLEIFARSLFAESLDDRARLAWFIEATGPAMEQYIWIDAESNVILLTFNQMARARSREVYNANHTSGLGALVRTEGGPATGDLDSDRAYLYAGVTYDYFLNNHGRDSYDGAGATIVSTTHYCAEDYINWSGACPDYKNAAWSGSEQRMVYADGFASADDVVAHELTHAITANSAQFLYYMQSGALSESYSDIFGETVDLLDGLGNDAPAVRWQIGEDLPEGAIRNMLNPPVFDDPAKMSDWERFKCSDSGWTDSYADSGGVHSNSGIPNHAYALMVDGGNYNGVRVTGLGLTKAARLHYRALTVYLTSGSGFSDHQNALLQSCTDLTGSEITVGDCIQVANALRAVEMDATWGCTAASKAPSLCTSGVAIPTFSEDFEHYYLEYPNVNWGATIDGAGQWSVSYGFARGTYSAWGTNPPDSSNHALFMSSSTVVPPQGRMYFDHAFEFESGLFWYDGAVLEYSTNNGSTWSDAGWLIDAGRNYNGTVAVANLTLGGQSAFVGSSFGYTGTRLNLAGLAGQTIRFRWRIGTDWTSGSLGWLIDNVQIYNCATAPSGSIYAADDTYNIGTVNPATGTSRVAARMSVVLTDIAMTPSGTLYGVDFYNLYRIDPLTGFATTIGAHGVSGMNALVANGESLLGASVESTFLYSISVATGRATALAGSLGYVSSGDLAFHNGQLYAAVKNGEYADLVRITMSGGSFTSTNLGHVLYGSLFGLAEGADGYLYGLSGTSILRLNISNPAAFTFVANYSAGGLGSANGAATRPRVQFTDEGLGVGGVIRAVHIHELQNRISGLLSARGQGLYIFSSIHPGTDMVKAEHIAELRSALAAVYRADGFPEPVYTDAAFAGGPIRAKHINELRSAIRVLE